MATAHPIPRHANFQNFAGRVYGRLTVLSFGGKRLGRSTWNCVCTCGKEVTCYAQPLKEGRSKSCGCLVSEAVIARCTTHGESAGKKTPEYRTWKAMKTRCGNRKLRGFKDYGGRGISVCQRWAESFEAFLEDMGRKPSPSHSLDRINNNGNYEPGNCRWATPKEQANNSRRWGKVK